MKILHILSDGPTEVSGEVIAIQSEGDEVKVIDLSSREASYTEIVEAIFSCDKVISW